MDILETFSVTRVVNSYGPQTRALGLGQEASPSKPLVKTEPTDGIEERLQNIETHLKVKGKQTASNKGPCRIYFSPLILKAPFTTAEDDKFCKIFPNFQKS